MSGRAPRRIAILGGGIAGLTAAWELSRPELGGRYAVTVYERDWKLGGKGASSRGVHGRIEEHGLHVWLGYYDNAFRLMREVYEQLDRPRTDPGCPVAGWRDAFIPAASVGARDERSHWVASFAGNGQEPGSATAAAGPLSPAAFLQRGLRLLADFSASLREEPLAMAGVVISASPYPPRRSAGDDFASALRQAEIGALLAAVESLRVLQAGVPPGSALGGRLLEFLERTREDLLDRLRRDDDARRSWQLADLMIACLRGIVADGLLGGAPSALAAIDELDFRDWLSRHGADPETLDSPLVRVMYDFVFAYENGDPARPRFAAGLGLVLSFKLFFEYKGAIFWKLRAGMGDVVFAPLYEALRARGVRFAFAHRVKRLHVDPRRGTIAAVSLVRHPAGLDLDPLVHVRGLPCFPARPAPRPREPARLVAGEDFDAIVLATALGVLPEICAELIEESPAWRAMTGALGTVATRSLQVWARADEQRLGWLHPGATVAGYASPFEVYASMTHTLAAEDWPRDGRPEAVGYFCGVLADGLGPLAARRQVEDDARDFLGGSVARYWPGFSEDMVVSRYARANVDPSDRYVQSLPGSGRWRLAADGSGYGNLVLAGDWIDNGHNAGCIEAAVLSGLEAANAVCDRPLMDGVLGSWSRT